VSEKLRGFGRSRVPPAFRYPNYRNYWFGLLGAVGGYQIFLFGQLWIVHKLTGSTLYLGFVGLANALPAIALNMLGGVAADRFNRTRLVAITQLFAATVVCVLAIVTVSELVRPWHVLVVAGLVSGTNAFNEPARLALYPQLVPEEALMSAVALNSSVWQGSRVVAPAFAGLIIAVFDTGIALFVAAAGMAFLALMLRGAPSVRSETVSRSPFADALEGLRYIRRNTTMFLLIGMSFFNSFFGMAYMFMMPVFAVDILDVGATGQGYLLSASGIGSLSATLWFTTRSTIRNHGQLIVTGAILSGSALVVFSLTAGYIGSMLLGLLLMVAVGGFTSIYILVTVTILQTAVREDLRGRVMGLFAMTWSMMPLGGMFVGGIAALVGTPWAVSIGGFAVAGFAITVALLNPGLRRFSMVAEA
jgi:MFS family permease|tara:strand:- start:9980 stop:11233 length:1254 start_codon:yes stop_codon:yes gene_type:complete